MKSAIKIFIGSFCAICSIGAFWGSVALFKVIHFITMDGLGDSREARGDGIQPSWWHDFIFGGWVLFYIPIPLLVGAGAWLLVVAFSTFKLLHSYSPDKTEQDAAANP